MKVNFHYGYPINLDIDCNKEVNVYIDQFTLDDIPKDSLRIIILQEPWREPLVPLVQKYQDRYTHLLTYQEELLDSNPKARLFHFPNSWVTGYVPKKKEFSVSTVVGGKNFLEGHALRHELWRKRDLITVPKKFYLSGNAKHSHSFVPWTEADYTGQLVLGASKEPLFDSMFHIAIENVSIPNFFTEKLIDCFQARTVPIYWGCTNIGEYFNKRGILIVKNLNEIEFFCNILTPEVYEWMLPAVEENYERSHKWCDQMGQLENMIKTILKEEGYA
jgi:hypothetical protein